MITPTIIRRRQVRRGKGPSPWPRLLAAALGVVLMGLLALAVAGTVVLVSGYRYLAQDLPSPDEFQQLTQTSFETTKIYDRTGQHLLWEVMDPEGGDRTKVPFDQIPVYMRQATVALEDQTFYTNPAGINIEGLLRAAWNNLRGLPVQGGSSITAQLARNVAMDPEERYSLSYERKLKEIILSYELTRRFPGPEGRDRILEWYLNTVPYGGVANGVEAASKIYFSKHAKDLTLAEAAMLAAIPEYPAMNPIDNPEAARERQGWVLDAMVAQGYITEAQAEAAKRAPVGKPSPPAEAKMEAPHFVTYLLPILEERYGKDAVYGGGLRVITSLDYDLQKDCETIVRDNVKGWDPAYKVSNAASVVIRPSTGEILAMVGSVDYHDETIDGNVNMAIEPRQPGSSFKPYTYAAAFEQGYAPASVFYDVRTSFPIEGMAPYVPENFDMKFHGPMPLRRALACSYNIPAVDLLDRIGVDSALEMAHRLGITTLRDTKLYGLALTLGGGEVSLLDHTYAYSVFANGGVMAGTPVPEDKREPGFRELDPVSILKVTDSQGNVIDEFKQPTLRGVLSPQVAYLITNVLSDNAARTPAYGPNSALVLEDRPAAAKTGTTNNYWDAWTMGYTPDIAVGVWVGNADRTPMESMWGGRGAAPIWHDIMERAHQNLPPSDFVEPPGMKWVTVDAESGLLPGPYTRTTSKELFIDGMEPTKVDDTHEQLAICRASGKLATPYCPPDEVEQQVFTIYPYRVTDWARQTGQPLPPTEYCDVHNPNLDASDASITSPGIYRTVGGRVQITGNARIGGFREYQLEFGQGLQPDQWFPIGGTHNNAVDNNVLEEWDTTGLSGLYTLRLTVRGDGDRQVSVPVTVDNAPPQVEVINPTDGDVYVQELDGYVNIQVTAIDDMAMDRVEYRVDGQPIGETRVAPYSLRWDLTMSDTQQSAVMPAVPDIPGGELTLEENGQPVVWRQEAQGQATVITREVGSGDEISRTTIIRDPDGTTLILPGGWGARWSKGGYQELHTIEAVAYDSAGNEVKSEPVTIYVQHR